MLFTNEITDQVNQAHIKMNHGLRTDWTYYYYSLRIVQQVIYKKRHGRSNQLFLCRLTKKSFFSGGIIVAIT